MVYSATMPQIYDAHKNSKKITIGDSCDDNINHLKRFDIFGKACQDRLVLLYQLM